MISPAGTSPRATRFERTFAAVAALAGAAGLCARDAAGALLIPAPLAGGLELLPFVYWCRRHCRSGAALESTLERAWALAVVAGGVALSGWKGNPWLALHACGVYALSRMLFEWLGSVYERLQRHLDEPLELARRWFRAWSAMILVAGAVLALPISTGSGVPDYRHNFFNHLLSSFFDATSAACLSGSLVFSMGEDHTTAGQAALWAVTMLSGLGFAALGLAIMRSFMTRAPSLGRVFWTAVVFLAVGAAAMSYRWHGEDASRPMDRAWWGIIHATSAIWNSGLTLRTDGLAEYFRDPVIFSVITTLCVAGSLGFPVLIELVQGPAGERESAGRGTEKAARTASQADRPWRRLAHWEAPLAVTIICFSVVMLWYFEHPQSKVMAWAPPRPFELEGQILLRDLSNQDRWRMGVLMSATLRSAGMQSIPLVEGTITWPTFGLVIAAMLLGGSAASTAGGMRTTALLLLFMCLLGRGWTKHAHGRAIRSMLLRRGAAFAILWLAANACGIVLLSLVASASLYERGFDAIAAMNGVGLSTGMIPHLTPAGRLMMIVLLIAGRAVPVWFWLDLSRRVRALEARDGANV